MTKFRGSVNQALTIIGYPVANEIAKTRALLRDNFRDPIILINGHSERG
jgi:hypothetical protein